MDSHERELSHHEDMQLMNQGKMKTTTQPIQMSQVKKRYRWALSTDFVILLIFVLVCVAVYKAFILGNYYGEAVHVISEILNDSYDYQSSDGEVEPNKEGNSSSRTAYRLNEDSGSEDQLLFKDICHG